MQIKNKNFPDCEPEDFFLLFRTQIETARGTIHRRGGVGAASGGRWTISDSESLELDFDRTDSKDT